MISSVKKIIYRFSIFTLCFSCCFRLVDVCLQISWYLDVTTTLCTSREKTRSNEYFWWWTFTTWMKLERKSFKLAFRFSWRLFHRHPSFLENLFINSFQFHCDIWDLKCWNAQPGKTMKDEVSSTRKKISFPSAI